MSMAYCTDTPEEEHRLVIGLKAISNNYKTPQEVYI